MDPVYSARGDFAQRLIDRHSRRFRIAITLGGVYVGGSLVLRIAFPTGAVADYGPAVLAIALAVVFLFAARDPVSAPRSAPGTKDR